MPSILPSKQKKSDNTFIPVGPVSNHDHSYSREERFGIIGDQEESEFWGANQLHTYDNALQQIESNVCNRNDFFLNIEDATSLITGLLNAIEIVSALTEQCPNSPLIKNYYTLSFLHCTEHPLASSMEDEDIHTRHLNQLIKLCGMQLAEMEKDGNCCFTATVTALKILWNNSTSEMKEKFDSSLPAINYHSGDVKEEGFRLRNLVYKEWVNNPEDYQEFLLNDVVNEAEYFLQDGFFASDLGDTLVMALSNALSIPIIVLTSNPNVPFLTFQPRTFAIFTPIILAYNQYGTGHYDAIQYYKSINETFTQTVQVTKCKCGVNDASGSSIQRCSPNSNYRSRCPCLILSLACSTACKCNNCNNPSGKRPPEINIRKRKRHCHDLQTSHTKEIVFLQDRNEKISIGGWSQTEKILFIHVVSHIERKGEKATPEFVHKVYGELVQYMNHFQLKLAIAQKSMSSFVFKLNELKKRKDDFKSCIN